jgi:hypothetical protein
VPSQPQVDILRRYCDERGIGTEGLRVELGRSEDALPNLRIEALDVFLIDGSHGFPTPMVDWFYGARLLRRGGALVLDDRQLPAVAALVDYLDADPRWLGLKRTPKWAAFERRSDGDLAEDWYDQGFYSRSAGLRAVLARTWRSRGRRRLSP